MAHATTPSIDRPGVLWVVATPIGNLDDLSDRARRSLAEADIIAAEDTRTSRKLLPPREAAPEWVALHEHNERQIVERLLDRIESGARVALVSDAGTPLISDPGFRLVRGAHERGLPVSPIPGPCAAIAALSAAGLASDRFRFEGFLPSRAGQRRQRLDALRSSAETLIFYVPSRDLERLIEELRQVFGDDRSAAVARELTKRFETVRRDELSGLAEWLHGDPDQKLGEAVVLVEGGAPTEAAPSALDPRRLATELAAELPPARAARLVARLCEMERREAFALVESVRGIQE
jgi:16S rRNA (cytidine1402-2'-O)-methyltransferase